MELDKIYNEDCMVGLKQIPDNSIDLVLTDIPYGCVNRESNGLRNLDKENADIVNFDITELTKELVRVCKGSIYMFCGTPQISPIDSVFRDSGLSTRMIVWEKTNPSPMNGEYIWLSGIELAVFGRKPNAPFNLRCKNTVLKYPSGESKIHPTQKPLDLFRSLVLASSNEGGLVLDCFMGSATTAIACIKEKRHFLGFELSKEYYDKACKRIEKEKQQLSLF